jgi:pimeloyl-ACP methyl ester carboxylesterase
LPGAQGATTVSVPNTVAPGTPWVYRIGFGGPDAKVDLALLAKGFHIVTGVVGTNSDGPLLKDWDQTYQHLTSHGFAAKAVMEGGGGAGEIYEWAINNPGKVACIYAENPELHSNLAKTQPLDSLAPLAQAKVPILHVCGSEDPWLKDNTLVLEQRYKALGGPIRVILKKGVGHFPTGPEDLAPVLDFITQAAAKPA